MEYVQAAVVIFLILVAAGQFQTLVNAWKADHEIK